MKHAWVTEAGLQEWGRAIGASVERPTCLALVGPLGAGKSTLARAIGRGAGYDGPMPSPTFNLVFRYDTPHGPLVHVDLYRLRSAEEVLGLGWEELFDDDALVLIEWPERAMEYLPTSYWRVELSIDGGRAEERRVVVEPIGSPGELPVLWTGSS